MVIIFNNKSGDFFKKHYLTLFISLILIFFNGCGDSKKKQPQAPATKVIVAEAVKRTVPIYEDFVASIDPTTGAATIDVRARVPAILEAQHFKEGDLVREGQLLFTLDPSTYQANLKNAEASLAKANSDYELARNQVNVLKAKADVDVAQAQLGYAKINESKLKPLMEQKAVPLLDYENSYSQLKVAEANLNQAKANLENVKLTQKVQIEQAVAEIATAKANISIAKINLGYCTITSPIEGYVGKRLVAPKNLVGQGEATLLTQVIDFDPIRINFYVSENEYLNFTKVNKSVKKVFSPSLKLILADGSTYEHTGKILISEPYIDVKTGTLLLVAQFPNPSSSRTKGPILKPGMFGKIRFIVDYQEGALIIPQTAINILQNAKSVYVVDKNNQVQLKTVDLGDNVLNNMVIVKQEPNGLQAGDRVIISGNNKVMPGMTVDPVIQDSPAGQKIETPAPSKGVTKSEKDDYINKTEKRDKNKTNPAVKNNNKNTVNEPSAGNKKENVFLPSKSPGFLTNPPVNTQKKPAKKFEIENKKQIQPGNKGMQTSSEPKEKKEVQTIQKDLYVPSGSIIDTQTISPDDVNKTNTESDPAKTNAGGK